MVVAVHACPASPTCLANVLSFPLPVALLSRIETCAIFGSSRVADFPFNVDSSPYF